MDQGSFDSGGRVPAEIAERRRRRRAEERRRRGRARLRNLLATAVIAVGIGVTAVIASGDDPASALREAERDGGGGGDGRAAEPPSEPVAIVTGFDEPVPILMYHVIAPAPADAVHPGLFVPPDELRSQLAWLQRNGYHAVTLSELFAAWERGEPIAERPVVLSFDDGTRDHYSTAAPALGEHGWPGVLNLKLESLEQGELSEGMVRELLGAGWEIASHTATHRDLTTLEGAELRREVAGSRRALSRTFEVGVEFFCYPGGSFDDATVRAVREAGYSGATTTEPGMATPGDPFRLDRIRVEPGDGSAGLAAKLRAAKDTV